MENDVRWHLELGGEVIARIADADEYDFPWTYGTVLDSQDFERFRPYFTDPDTWRDDDQELDALCSEVRSKGGFRLHDFQTGIVHQPITLNQCGSSVWFRIG